MVVPLSYLRWLPVIMVTGALGAVASVSGSSLPDFLHHGMDKFVHAIVYSLLAASYLYGFGPMGKGFPYRISFATGFFCLLYALCEEWYQQFIPGRIADRFDLRADIIGFLSLISLWLMLTLILKKKR